MSTRQLALFLALSLAPPAFAAAPQTVLIQADAAWVGPGERIAPAYVLVKDGEIQAVSARPLQASGALVLKVAGTLAPGVVDAWGAPVPADLLASGHRPAGLDLRDSLPIALAGADPALASRVAAARACGIAAVYLGPGGRAPLRGTGTAAGWSETDLPVASGDAVLELAAGSALAGGWEVQTLSRDLEKLFEGAEAFRDQESDYEEKLEQYEKDLADYQKKLEEYKKKKDEAEKKEEGGEAGGGASRKPPSTGGEKGEGNGQDGAKPDKKDEPPARPKRPEPPVADAAMKLLLQAIDGTIQVRVEANSVADIRTLLRLRERLDLDLVLVGGLEADLLADELAEAEVPVVLAAFAEPASPLEPSRALAARFQRLAEAGVDLALASGGSDGSQAFLMARAGGLVAAGADPEQVWAALTSVPARILGLDQDYGRLAKGARAELLLFEGSSPFDVSAPQRVFAAARGFDR